MRCAYVETPLFPERWSGGIGGHIVMIKFGFNINPLSLVFFIIFASKINNNLVLNRIWGGGD